MTETSMIDVGSLAAIRPVVFPYPMILREAVESAFVSWQKFCSLLRDDKMRLVYRNDAGFEFKEEPGATRDLKENLHVNRREMSRLQEAATPIAGGDGLKLILMASVLLDLVDPLILNFARSMESTFGLVGLSDEVVSGVDSRILRYLHYFGDRQVGDEIATAHADKSGFTLHLFESHSGLQYLDLSKNWQPMPVSPGQTVMIANMQLQLRSRNRLKALCHRVVATEETAQSGRYSILCFVPLTGTPAYKKREKGRLQEFTPGFNYDMQFEQFQTLFG